MGHKTLIQLITVVLIYFVYLLVVPRSVMCCDCLYINVDNLCFGYWQMIHVIVN